MIVTGRDIAVVVTGSIQVGFAAQGLHSVNLLKDLMAQETTRIAGGPAAEIHTAVDSYAEFRTAEDPMAPRGSLVFRYPRYYRGPP